MLDGITSNLPLWAPFLTVSLQLTKTDFRLLFHIFFQRCEAKSESPFMFAGFSHCIMFYGMTQNSFATLSRDIPWNISKARKHISDSWDILWHGSPQRSVA